ncbi:hypothetical protein BDL97_20G003700 [Sphagnum fallax]|nr:hypothetical protein BDL97_20G003700 [Sphagnum fallax]
MGKEKFLANVRPAAADVQEEEQSRFTGRTIKSKKHLQGPIVREEASLEHGLPQLEDSSIIPAKGSDVNATSSVVSQVVQARTDVVIGGGGSESDSAQISEIILAEDLDSTSEEVESTISSSSNSGLHRRSRKLATMMSVDENNSLLSTAAQSRRAIQSVPCYPDCSQQSAHYRESNEVWTANTSWVLVQLKVIEDWPLLMCGLTLPVFPISALLVEKLKLYTPISEKVFLCM